MSAYLFSSKNNTPLSPLFGNNKNIKVMKYLFILLVLCSCRCNNKEVSSISDLRDNVYESLVLSFPDANDEDIVDLYYLYKDKLDSLSYDEVVVF